MAYVSIPATDTDAGSPVDRTLMDTIRLNEDDLDSRVGGGGGGAGGFFTGDDEAFAVDVTIPFDVAKMTAKRFSLYQHITIPKGNSPTYFDYESENENELMVFMQDNSTGYVFNNANVDSYLGQTLNIPQNESIYFKKKKGLNWFSFSIRHTNAVATFAAATTVTVDGASLTNYEDENGTAYGGATINTTGADASARHGNTFYIFGLDKNKEELIQIQNSGAGGSFIYLESVTIGHRPDDGSYSIDHTLTHGAGSANVRGTVVDVPDGTLAFSTTEVGNMQSMVVDTSGTVTSVKTAGPCMAKLKPQSYTFTSAVTSLEVKNNFVWPDQGIADLHMPWGESFRFSYSSKTDTSLATNINNHSFEGVQWLAQPSVNFTPRLNLDVVATLGANLDAYCTIHAGDETGFVVQAGNNKIDYAITLAGGTEVIRNAVIDAGFYTADFLLPEKIVEAMNTAQDISSYGEYYAEYLPAKRKWSIGVRGNGITSFKLLNNTGVDSANSILINSMGYVNTADLTGALSYQGTNEVNHLASQVSMAGPFLSHSHPQWKYTFGNTFATNSNVEDLKQRLGLNSLKSTNSENGTMKFYPSQDAIGAIFVFPRMDTAKGVYFIIDDVECLFTPQLDYQVASDSSNRGSIAHAKILFPRGTKQITIPTGLGMPANAITTTSFQLFVSGCYELFDKPNTSALSTTEAIVENFLIQPDQIYRTRYSGDASTRFYAPTGGTTDHIDTVTPTGTFTHIATGFSFNNHATRATGINDTLDITFQVFGSHGGFSIRSTYAVNISARVEVYLVQGNVASEAGSLIDTMFSYRNTADNNVILWDMNSFSVMGLPTGQYTVRLKNKQGTLDVISFEHYDSDVIDENVNTVAEVTGNADMGLSVPLYTRALPCLRDNIGNFIPSYLERSGFRDGEVQAEHIGSAIWDYAISFFTFENFDDVANVKNLNQYYGSQTQVTDVNDFFRFHFMGRSFGALQTSVNNRSTVVQVDMDGIAALNNFSMRIQAKTGRAPTTQNSASVMFTKIYEERFNADPGSTTVIPLADTRGIRPNQTAFLTRDGLVGNVKVIVLSVAAGVSVTIKNAVSDLVTNFTTANNARIHFGGFHSIEMNNNDAGIPMNVTAWWYEPFPITFSRYNELRKDQRKVGETARIIYESVVNLDDLYPPFFASDGRLAENQELVKTWFTTGGTGSFNPKEDLKNVEAAASPDVELIAIRKF